MSANSNDTLESLEFFTLDEKIDYAIRLLIRQGKLKQKLIHSFPDIFKLIINRTRNIACENQESGRTLNVEEIQLIIINLTQRVKFEIFGEGGESPYEVIDRLRKSLDSFKEQFDQRALENQSLIATIEVRNQKISELEHELELLIKPTSEEELQSQIRGLKASVESFMSANENLKGIVASQRLLLERLENRNKKPENLVGKNTNQDLSAVDSIQVVGLQERLVEMLDNINRLEVLQSRADLLNINPDLKFSDEEFIES